MSDRRRTGIGETASPTADPTRIREASRGGAGTSLSNREREIMGMLADGASGAEIAERLVLSPETVRTHIRNAMSKLSASSRAHAVALAVKRGEIDWPASANRQNSGTGGALPHIEEPGSRASSAPSLEEVDATLTALLGGVVSEYEAEGGAVFLAEEDGVSLQRVAMLGHGRPISGGEFPERIRLGRGSLGRAALRPRAQLVHRWKSSRPADGRATIYAPMIAAGRLVGVICLMTRPGRLVGRSELLLMQTFADRVGEILVAPRHDQRRRLKAAFRRLRAARSAAPA